MKIEYIAAVTGQRFKIKANCTSAIAIRRDNMRDSRINVFDKLYTHNDWKFKRKEVTDITIGVAKNGSLKENVIFVSKNNTTIVSTKETILALRSKFIVLIADTAKIFWVKKREYSPKAYSKTIAIRVKNLAGIS